MLKKGILNPELNRRLSLLGHTDLTFIVDAGMPLPISDAVVDLSLVAGIPSFAEVFSAIVDKIEIEAATVAVEARGQPSSELWRNLTCPIEQITHEELKVLLTEAKLIIRTGECTPFANIALRSGVPF